MIPELSNCSWDKPVLVAWGMADKHLKFSEAEEFQKGNPVAVEITKIEGAGHMPQEDWYFNMMHFVLLK